VNARPPGRDDIDLLLDPLIRHAQKELRELDRMWPVGAALTTDGKIELIEIDQADPRTAEEQLAGIRANLRDRAAAGAIRASGITYDGEIDGLYNEITKAVTTELEHVTGDSVNVYLNYRHSGPNGAVRFGRLMARPREDTIFSPLEPESPGT
jgi:hypothetical protein